MNTTTHKVKQNTLGEHLTKSQRLQMRFLLDDLLDDEERQKQRELRNAKASQLNNL